MNYSSDFEIVREIKEDFCFISADYEKDKKLANQTCCFEKKFTLPDGSDIKLGKERFEATEILFNPNLNGVECKGTSDIVFDSIDVNHFNLELSYWC